MFEQTEECIQQKFVLQIHEGCQWAVAIQRMATISHLFFFFEKLSNSYPSCLVHVSSELARHVGNIWASQPSYHKKKRKKTNKQTKQNLL
jgi:hypothetical protein